MPLSEARKRANEKYVKEKLEDVRLRVPKGMKAEIQEHATAREESVNGFILRAIRETMANDGKLEAKDEKPLKD